MTDSVVETPATAVAVVEVEPAPEAVTDAEAAHLVIETQQSDEIGELRGLMTSVHDRLGSIETRLDYVESCAREAEQTAEEAEDVAEAAAEIAVVAAVEAVETAEEVEDIAEVVVEDDDAITEVAVIETPTEAEVEASADETPARRKRRRPYQRRRA